MIVTRVEIFKGHAEGFIRDSAATRRAADSGNYEVGRFEMRTVRDGLRI